MDSNDIQQYLKSSVGLIRYRPHKTRELLPLFCSTFPFEGFCLALINLSTTKCRTYTSLSLIRDDNVRNNTYRYSLFTFFSLKTKYLPTANKNMSIAQTVANNHASCTNNSVFVNQDIHSPPNLARFDRRNICSFCLIYSKVQAAQGKLFC